MCEGAPSESERDFVEPQSFSFSKKRNFACVANQENKNYEGTLVKAPRCPTRRMRTPLPQQNSFSSMEEGSPWSAQERTAFARMELEDYSLGPEYSDVDVKHIFRNATREGRNIFEVFQCERKGEHPVAGKWRWDDCQR